MVVSRSTDDGKTWSQPIEIDAHPGLPRDDNGAAEGFDGAVASGRHTVRDLEPGQ